MTANGMDMVAFANRLLAVPNWKETKQGIAVIYKDGTKDWFDPVSEVKTEGDILKIMIENGNVYDVKLLDTNSVNRYDV